MTITHTAIFEGPLPPPEARQKYELILPGMTDRLVTLHEKAFELTRDQSVHRQGFESRVISGNISSSKLGQWTAAAIVAMRLAAGTFLIYAGKSPEGLWAMFTPLGAVLSTFIFTRKKQDSELARKRSEIDAADDRAKSPGERPRQAR